MTSRRTDTPPTPSTNHRAAFYNRNDVYANLGF